MNEPSGGLPETATNLTERAAEALPPSDDELARLAALTPARVAQGRAGPAYRTATQLALRAAHATAVDAVRAACDLKRDWGEPFVARWNLLEGQSEARSLDEHLLRPDLGRRLDHATRTRIVDACPARADLQIVIGDGLSATAVRVQVPRLLPRLHDLAAGRGMTVGRPIFLRYARVGLLNDLGDLLDPTVVVLLIGERPGMATAESLSAYLAYRPRGGHTDAQRNLISNIHDRGVPVDVAARRILALAVKLMHVKSSGVEVKEDDVACLDANDVRAVQATES